MTSPTWRSKLQHASSTPNLQAKARPPTLARSHTLGAWAGALRRTFTRGGGSARDSKDRKGKARERAVKDIPEKARKEKKHTNAREYAKKLGWVTNKENRAPEESGVGGDGKGDKAKTGEACTEGETNASRDAEGSAVRVEVPAGRRAPLGDVTDLYAAHGQSSRGAPSSMAGAASLTEEDMDEENDENELYEG